MSLQNKLLNVLKKKKLNNRDLDKIASILNINLDMDMKDIKHKEFISKSKSKLLDDEYDLLMSKEYVRNLKVPKTKQHKEDKYLRNIKEDEYLRNIESDFLKDKGESLIQKMGIKNLPKSKPKPKSSNPWIQFVKDHQSKNPHFSWSETIKDIKSKDLYKPGTSVIKGKVVKSTRNFKCGICGKVITNQSNFKRHMRNHMKRIIVLRGIIKNRYKKMMVGMPEYVRKKRQHVIDVAEEEWKKATAELKILEDAWKDKEKRTGKIIRVEKKEPVKRKETDKAVIKKIEKLNKIRQSRLAMIKNTKIKKFEERWTNEINEIDKKINELIKEKNRINSGIIVEKDVEEQKKPSIEYTDADKERDRLRRMRDARIEMIENAINENQKKIKKEKKEFNIRMIEIWKKQLEMINKKMN